MPYFIGFIIVCILYLIGVHVYLAVIWRHDSTNKSPGHYRFTGINDRALLLLLIVTCIS